MSRYILAVDIGASSGRHILCTLSKGKMALEEIYRFENGSVCKNGQLMWDTEGLFRSVTEGLKECKRLGKVPETMAIDTWGVDYMLLDEAGNDIGGMTAYRDKRTEGMDKQVEALVDFAEYYRRTGIQKQPYNTVYQLMALKNTAPEQLEKAKSLMMVPQYLNYRLTGVQAAEYTQATTSALVNAASKDWDWELLGRLGYPKEIFLPLHMPGETVGRLTPEIAAEVGFDLTVLHCASHDTASAFLAVPALDENAVYISSGTWSLLGVENEAPLTGEDSCKANFTNEGGYAFRYRFLKNIMGLWMIQSVRRNLDKKYSFQQLEELARGESDFPGRVNVNDNCFLNPDSMVNTVTERATVRPENLGQLMTCIYRSLAECYRDAIGELSALTGKAYTSINIVGGGSKDGYLNALTAEAAGLPVYAGPTEGTAIGNLLVQYLAAGEFSSLREARDCIRNSFTISKIEL